MFLHTFADTADKAPQSQYFGLLDIALELQQAINQELPSTCCRFLLRLKLHASLN